MSTTIPQTMKALVASEQKGSATVREVPVPQLDDNEVLIKVQYAAQVSRGAVLYHLESC